MHLLSKFEYHEPSTIEEACEMMTEFKSDANMIAGGTDLIVKMKHKTFRPKHLVSLSRIKELNQVKRSDNIIRIGACFTAADLAESELIKTLLSALNNGAANLGSPLVRNRATIGGNVCTARPAADLPPSLMAYGAKAVLKKKSGEREMSLEDFFKGPGMTAIDPAEVLVEFRIDLPGPMSGAGYLNIGIRKAQDCNLVNLASFIELDKNDLIRNARVAMGCVGPTHLRAPSAENILIGQKAGEALFKEAAHAAMKDSKAISDFRASADYKRDMIGVLARRTLDMALEEATKQRG